MRLTEPSINKSINLFACLAERLGGGDQPGGSGEQRPVPPPSHQEQVALRRLPHPRAGRKPLGERQGSLRKGGELLWEFLLLLLLMLCVCFTLVPDWEFFHVGSTRRHSPRKARCD